MVDDVVGDLLLEDRMVLRTAQVRFTRCRLTLRKRLLEGTLWQRLCELRLIACFDGTHLVVGTTTFLSGSSRG